MRDIHILVVFVLAAGLSAPLFGQQDPFRDNVAPILAEHCVACHNRSDPKGDFSLEDSGSFFDSNYVDPGDSGASHLIDLIQSDSPDQRPEMPKTGPALTDDQVNSIRKWIDAGAKWPEGFVISSKDKSSFDWWAFNRIQRPLVPRFTDDVAVAWTRTPIDAFVLRELRKHQLSPSTEADRRTLIRRLSYDLTGLPPTHDEIKQFEFDDSSDAYEKLVDRLLASPRYGERWARHWLDVVKYADTCGYDKDKLRANAWPYRDYVIRSLNSDKPYKQFVQEQIAGDVLYPGSADGILGLGFVAAGPWDFIGHVEVPESKIDGKVARYLDRDDMVSNTINTFCSVTIQCARCHDHKFDPFTQEHYFGLQAVFAAVDRAERVYDDDPELAKKRQSLQDRIRQYENQLALLESNIAEQGGEELKRLDREINQIKQKDKLPEFGYHSQIAAVAEVEKWVEIELEEATPFSKIILRPCHDEFANIGPGFGFPVRFRIEIDGQTAFDQTRADFRNPGLDPVIVPITATATKVRVVATQLAPRDGDFMFSLAEIQLMDDANENIALGASVLAHDSTEAPVRWRKANLTDGIWYEGLRDSDRRDQLKQTRQQYLVKRLGQDAVDQRLALPKKIAGLKKQLQQLPAGKMVYAAATTFPAEGNFKPTNGKKREIRVLSRGDVQSPEDVVFPGVLPLSGNDEWKIPVDEHSPESKARAALAQWLTRDEHPLTWRSIVNRVWHYHFGRGIVDTPNDLGRMGGAPTHQELLDWLAVEFRDGGGSLKQLHRLIVTSSVYRQTSTVDAESNGQLESGDRLDLDPLQVDSGNRLLWKMNRRRLSAEEIRDAILLASGQLNLRMGGPGYYLFDLEKTEHSPHFEYHKFDHHNKDSYRRSIYRFIVRSQPDPYMTTLDCADSSQSTPARNETQTPLQSLTMLNSRFNLTMAEKFADRVRSEANSTEEQIEHAMRRALGRSPTVAEKKLMSDYAQRHGLGNLSRVIFNLSEFVYVD